MVNYRNPVVQQDLKSLYESSVNWESLQNKTILVTGATGMLASWFSFMLFYLNEYHGFSIKIILLARNKKKYKHVFGNINENTELFIQDIIKEIKHPGHIDYILHAAGSASPYYILNDPVGIIKANTMGTHNVLELAWKAKARKVLFTSTREVYGKVENKSRIAETDMGTLNPLDARSCYPESKRMAETMLKSYSIQHGVHFNALRIAHTYGPGIRIRNDGRVMGDLLRDALDGRNIQLKSAGKAERAFCYITDAMEAIFRILIRGKDDEAYNIANETEPVKILALAKLVQETAGNSKGVTAATDNGGGKAGYTSYKRVKLDTSKIEQSGWRPKVSLKEGLAKTLRSFDGN